MLREDGVLAIFAHALVLCLVVNDAAKVVMIKWRVPTAAASRTTVLSTCSQTHSHTLTIAACWGA